MRYYEVLIADGHYHGSTPLTYAYDGSLATLSVVSVTLRQRPATGFVLAEVAKPEFTTKPIKALLSDKPLPYHCLGLAQWLQDYYCSTAGEALRQFAPAATAQKRRDSQPEIPAPDLQLETSAPLTANQTEAIRAIQDSPSTTIMLHGDTGSGKTRVYMELARSVLAKGRSAIILTPEISLTAQMALIAKHYLSAPIFVLHSQLSVAARKKIWFEILESAEPVVVIGPRSALFSPVESIGLIVLDEVHEPAYKQEQSPRYQAARVASQLGVLTGAKVVLGTATPPIGDYYLASEKSAVVRMDQAAITSSASVSTTIVDLKERAEFSRNPFLSNQLIDDLKEALEAKKQALIYLNRRGSARLILCSKCSWHYFCPNCDIPLTYHGDEHLARCHTCGFAKTPPMACPKCNNPEIIYKSIGTKALIDMLERLFPQARIRRFDGDNLVGEHLNELYTEVKNGKIDILVGTQLIAKGLDLPNLQLVGVVAAEASLAIPDYTAEERTFQLLYQVIGRVGRGHGDGKIVIQSYDPNNIVIQSAADRNWGRFYKHALLERRQFRFPPFSHLLQLSCRRTTSAGAQKAAEKLKSELIKAGLAVEIIGPTPPFYARRGKYHYCQIVVKSKQRDHLVKLARLAPADWQINLDPNDLL